MGFAKPIQRHNMHIHSFQSRDFHGKLDGAELTSISSIEASTIDAEPDAEP